MRTIVACFLALLLPSTTYAQSPDDEIKKLKVEISGLKEMQDTLLKRIEELIAAQTDGGAKLQALASKTDGLASDLQANKPVITTQLWRGRSGATCPSGMAAVFAVCGNGAGNATSSGENFYCPASRTNEPPLKVYCVPFATLDAQ